MSKAPVSEADRNYRRYIISVSVCMVLMVLTVIGGIALSAYAMERNMKQVKKAEAVVEGENYAIFETSGVLTDDQIAEMVNNYLKREQLESRSVIQSEFVSQGQVPGTTRIWITFEPREMK